MRVWQRSIRVFAVAALLAGFALAHGSLGRRAASQASPAAEARSGETAACAELTPAAARGKRIFRKGTTAAGRAIEGVLDGGAAVLRGREAACAGCHSAEGAGNSEGGVSVPSIVPERLFSASRGRGPYDPVTLGAAIREGQTPTRQLNLVMPRYRFGPEELADLIAYLRCVGHDSDPGVTAGALALGAALPLTGPLASVGGAVRDVLEASFAEINAQGGVFRRRLELVVEDSGERGGEHATSRLIDRGVFALVGSVMDEQGGRAALEARLEAEGVPLIGPVSERPPETSRSEGVVFDVAPGLDTLARVAIKHLADSSSSAQAAEGTATLVLRPRGTAGDGWLAGARAEASARGLGEPVDVPYDPGRLLEESGFRKAVRAGAGAHTRKARAALFLGTSDDLLRCAAAFGDRPRTAPVIYAPAFLMGEAGSALPAAQLRQVRFIYPGSLDGTELRGQRTFSAFLRSRGIAPRHVALQLRARMAAGIAVEALKRAGAQVTRDGLLGALEGLRDFDAGAGPALSFGKNRRAGVMGASVLQLDPERRDVARASAWIEVVQ